MFARRGVLGVGIRQAAAQSRGVGVIDAFALPHRLKSENDEAQLRQSLAEALIAGVGFAFPIMPALKEHGGKRPAALIGDIEIRGDEQVGTALVNDLVHAVVRSLKTPGDAGVERGLRGLAANQSPEGVANPRLPRPDGGRRREPGERIFPLACEARREV